MNTEQQRLLTDMLLYLTDHPRLTNWVYNPLIHTAIKSHLESNTKLPRKMCNEFVNNYVKERIK